MAIREGVWALVAMRTVMEDSLPQGGVYVFEDDTETILALGPGIAQDDLSSLVEGIERRASEQVYQVPSVATRIVPEPLEGLCDAYDELRSDLADGGNCEAFVVLARNYIDTHYWNPDLCLEHAAAELQISAGYLSRLMKRETGFSFVEYLNRIRVKKATLLMSDPSAKAFEVAERVGYRSQHYFSRAFKKVTGNSPTDFRKRSVAMAVRVRWVTAIAVLFVATFFASCSQNARGSGMRYLVGFSQANLTEPWRIEMTEEVKAEAARDPDMKIIYTDAADSTSRQIDDVRRLMEYGIDLMIISPTDSHELTPVVREVYSKIPVIVLDRAVEGFDYSLFIGPDNERLGREAGGVISELLGTRNGTILEIQGRSGSPPTLSRSQGLREVLAKHPNIKIVDTIVADWLRDTAEDTVAQHIRVIPNIDVIFAQNDAMALGAWRATQVAGRRGIKFIGIDGLPGPTGGIELVRKGVLSATFTCPTGGKEAVIYARDLLLKKEGIPKRIFLRPLKVTPEVLSQGRRLIPATAGPAKDSQPPYSARLRPSGFRERMAGSQYQVHQVRGGKSRHRFAFRRRKAASRK